MPSPFKEFYFNTKTKEKFKKHHFVLDPKNPMMQMLGSLYDFQQRWIAKEGALPEEIDASCIDMLGMRFSILLATMYELHTRNLLVQQGSLADPFAYMHEMHVNGKTYPISKQEHEEIVHYMEILCESGERIPEFLDSLSDFAI